MRRFVRLWKLSMNLMGFKPLKAVKAITELDLFFLYMEMYALIHAEIKKVIYLNY